MLGRQQQHKRHEDMSLFFEQCYTCHSHHQGREGAGAEARPSLQPWTREPALGFMEGQETTTAPDRVPGEGIRCRSPRCWGAAEGTKHAKLTNNSFFPFFFLFFFFFLF